MPLIEIVLISIIRCNYSSREICIYEDEVLLLYNTRVTSDAVSTVGMGCSLSWSNTNCLWILCQAVVLGLLVVLEQSIYKEASGGTALASTIKNAAFEIILLCVCLCWNIALLKGAHGLVTGSS